MLANTRQNEICKIIKEKSAITTAMLSEKFGVSFDERFQTALHDTAKYLDNTPETVSIRPEYLFVQNQIVIRFMD